MGQGKRLCVRVRRLWEWGKQQDDGRCRELRTTFCGKSARKHKPRHIRSAKPRSPRRPTSHVYHLAGKKKGP